MKTISALLLLTIIVTLHSVGSVKEVTIDAAYTTKSLLNLVVGNELMFVGKAIKREYVVLTITQPPELAELTKQAAVSSFNTEVRDIFFYGPDNGLFVQFTNNDEFRYLNYDSMSALFGDGGPDAAAKKGKHMYVFKGCMMANSTDMESFNTPTGLPEGMPCHLDAAWNDGSDMIILKGNKIWTWRSDGTVSDSSDFHATYSLESWLLKPKPE